MQTIHFQLIQVYYSPIKVIIRVFQRKKIYYFSPTGHRVGNTEVKSGFIPSLFENVPPTIRFCTENQRSMNIILIFLFIYHIESS